ncbi:hypothetical protein [Leptothoe sp. PORK10 BA2]|uniref:hypothetical protein n=1 Tax=Leptothoe sp. PORK10 BA2 TaxID=3110254 RepID=UPI002B2089F9|nr:hypothetical protein [Leptothoe sp. PORK10 BA2]MEA5464799.1 hypothetical protein [Leptothoe sp. PORK10 BA2]
MGSDVLILTIYFLIIIYVLYQMALSVENTLEDKLEVALDRQALLEQVNLQLKHLPSPQQITAKVDQLEMKGIKFPPFLNLSITSHNDPDNKLPVMVDVGPTGKMPIAKSIKDLSISIQNITGDAQIFVDWDKSSIISGKARRTQRVIRSGVPITGGLPQAQLLSVVNPGETFIAQVTGENCLGFDPESQTLQAKRSLVEMMDIADYITDMMELNSALGDTEDKPTSLAYGLRLMIGIRQITYQQQSQTTYLMLPFEFKAILLEDTIAFPPLRWLLNRPRPANARDALSTLLLGRPRS